jgi:hypothetical protein
MESTGLSGWPGYFGIFNVWLRCGSIVWREGAQPSTNFGIKHNEKLEN